MIALYVGEVDENKIYEMTYPFYTSVISEIGYMLNYQAMANILGNPYAGEEGIKAVSESNPLQITRSQSANGNRKKATIENLKFLNG